MAINLHLFRVEYSFQVGDDIKWVGPRPIFVVATDFEAACDAVVAHLVGNTCSDEDDDGKDETRTIAAVRIEGGGRERPVDIIAPMVE